jgi:hypothetical protein
MIQDQARANRRARMRIKDCDSPMTANLLAIRP